MLLDLGRQLIIPVRKRYRFASDHLNLISDLSWLSGAVVLLFNENYNKALSLNGIISYATPIFKNTFLNFRF